MPRKKKGQLASGSIRVQVYVGKDSSGKRQYKSFTAATRQEAEELARVWKINKDSEPKPHPTVGHAIDTYIETCRRSGASPSTLRGYLTSRANSYSMLEDIDIHDLTLSDIQAQINARASVVQPKTIRNELALLHAACKYERPDLSFSALRLPRRKQIEMEIPTDDQIRLILSTLAKTDGDMYLAVLLAAVMGLRRSEICALQWDDIDFKRATMRINKALVIDEMGSYNLKQPKTMAGNRRLAIPSTVLQELKARRTLNPRVVPITPNTITTRYERLTEKLEVPGRFHDLRHYHASTMIAVGAPEKYICADMGHASFDMVRRVYGHVKESRAIVINAAMDQQASVLMQHEMQHEVSS